MNCSRCLDAPAVYVAWMEWCCICNGHPVCADCGAAIRRDPSLVRLHTLDPI